MLAGKKWRNIENIRGKRGGEKLKNAEMRGINNNIRCFEMIFNVDNPASEIDKQ